MALSQEDAIGNPYANSVASLGGLATSVAQAFALNARGQYQRQMGDINAHLSDMQSADALARGATEAGQTEVKANKVASSARATQAASGIDVNSGSALDMQNESRLMGAVDAITIRNNAMREAFGYNMQAINERTNAQFEQQASQFQMTNTLLAGGLNSLAYGLKAYAGFNQGGGQTNNPNVNPIYSTNQAADAALSGSDFTLLGAQSASAEDM